MPSADQDNILIPGNDLFQCFQLVWWTRCGNRKATVISSGAQRMAAILEKNVFFLKKYIRQCVKFAPGAVVGEHKQLFYNVHQEAIDLTLAFYDQNIRGQHKYVSFHDRLFKTDKFEAYVKKKISGRIFSILIDLHSIRLSVEHLGKTILIVDSPVNRFVLGYMQEKYGVQYRTRLVGAGANVLPMLAYYGWLTAQFLRRGIAFNRPRRKFKLAKEAVHGFKDGILKDDVLLGHHSTDDFLLLKFFNSDERRNSVFRSAQENGYHVVDVQKLSVNLNRHWPDFLYIYAYLPARWCFYLLWTGHSYAINYLLYFYKEALPIEILMNVCHIDYYHSTNDYDDVAATIIFNKYGTRNVIFHWSDLTFFPAYNHAFIAHNIYCVWGDIHYDYHARNYFVEEKLNIGCVYKDEFNRAMHKQEDTHKRIKDFDRSRPTVAFFDTSFSNEIQNVNTFYLTYMELIRDYCRDNKNINVLLKPKDVSSVGLQAFDAREMQQYQEIFGELEHLENFYYLDPADFHLAQVAAIADVVVSMGMNSPSTVAICCGKNALYFDVTGNIFHPFAKHYKDQIVFDNKEKLFLQIERMLNGAASCKDIIDPTLYRAYDAFDDDQAIQRLTGYLFNTANSLKEETTELSIC